MSTMLLLFLSVIVSVVICDFLNFKEKWKLDNERWEELNKKLNKLLEANDGTIRQHYKGDSSA